VLSRRIFLAAAAPLLSAEWKSIFDGTTAQGWRCVGKHTDFPTHSWTIDSGCLKALVTKPTFQDIRTVGEFEDFELEFEWRIAPGGNSGVKYLIYQEDEWTPPGATGMHARGRGFEYQIADDAAMKSDLDIAGALYEFQAPTRRAARPVGDFNTARIVRHGPLIEHWLNGFQVLALRLDSPETRERMRARKVPVDLPKRSPIVLQNHSSEAWFRRLRIRSL
jgi:hypothetical protein